MKKRILSLVAALALASAIVAPVQAASNAEMVKDTGHTAKEWVEIKSSQAQADYAALNNNAAKSKVLKEVTDYVVDWGIDQVDTGKVKVQLVDNGKVNVITGDAKDNLQDNAIKPFVRECVKAQMEAKANKVYASDIVGIYEANVTANSTGDVAFKVDLDQNAGALSGDCYAIVMHYTGNASDEDGVTSQICKISTGGKVTAHINSFSPVGIITTRSENAQKVANTWSKPIGSDGGDAATTTTTTTGTTVPTEVTTTQPTDAQPTGTKNNGAASPKTSDNAYALYLILAVAAVAGTTLVATKKTR